MGYGDELLSMCINIESWGRVNLVKKGSKGKNRNRYHYREPDYYDVHEAGKLWLDDSHAKTVAIHLFYNTFRGNRCSLEYNLSENHPILRAYQAESKKRSAWQVGWNPKEFVETLAINEIVRNVTIDSISIEVDADLFLMT